MTDPHPINDSVWDLQTCGLQEVQRLAEILALELKAGDCIRLIGDLGAGKTTFATFLIRAYAGNADLTVPSPTFTLLERYDVSRGTIHHADLYRLEDPDEADELGLDEALDTGTLLIEWPDNAPHAAGHEHLSIAFEIAGTDETRRIYISGTPTWSKRLERMQERASFLKEHVAPTATIGYLQGDASTRKYARIFTRDETTVLMDSPAMPDGPPIRDGKPYSEIAHLAETVIPFVAVAKSLRASGLSAPNIRAANLEDGFLLLDDLGDRTYGHEIANGADIYPLYEKATDVLLHLRQFEAPETIDLEGDSAHHVPDFDAHVFAIETQLFPDWYIPAALGAPVTTDILELFTQAWDELYEAVRGHRHWVLRDFHSPNLLHLPDKSGIEAVGVIDFQDAMRGHAAYDLAALLQDARLDVPENIEHKLLNRYCTHAARASQHAAFDEDTFRRAYAILGAQRNTKILGIFARLAHRDGKRAYLAHIPRIWGYLERNLEHPDLKPLKAWYDTHIPIEIRKRPLA